MVGSTWDSKFLSPLSRYRKREKAKTFSFSIKRSLYRFSWSIQYLILSSKVKHLLMYFWTPTTGARFRTNRYHGTPLVVLSDPTVHTAHCVLRVAMKGHSWIEKMHFQNSSYCLQYIQFSSKRVLFCVRVFLFCSFPDWATIPRPSLDHPSTIPRPSLVFLLDIL
jgi:hypothetical protein